MRLDRTASVDVQRSIRIVKTRPRSDSQRAKLVDIQRAVVVQRAGVVPQYGILS